MRPATFSVTPDAARRARLTTRPRIALAMAGGGPLGAIYEIGALTALAESLSGVDFNDLDMYVGVSAGGILGAGLANGIAPREMCRMFVESDDARGKRTDGEFFDPALLMQPALGEYWRRMRSLPTLVVGAVWHFARRGWRGDPIRGLFSSFERLTRALPTGLFSNEGLQTFLVHAFQKPGRSNDFRALKARLYLVATDLDSGQSVNFGAPGYDDVPISVAAAASSALPGLFPPVEINGRHYLDGALKRTLHASVALQAGARLVLCLNPLVPYNDGMVRRVGGRPRRLVDGGLPVVLAQTFRAAIHSRMNIGMRQYEDDYPGADVMLFEPSSADADMFFTSLFSYGGRRRICEHAYQKTRADLWERRHVLAPVLARHGIELNHRMLRDHTRTLVEGVLPRAPQPPLPVTAITKRLADCLNDLDRYLRYAEAARTPA